MADDHTPVLDDRHATMAVGALGASLASRVDRDTGTLELPEPPEWLALWEQAVAATRSQAEFEIREERQRHRELARSVADVTDGGREPTGLERVEIEAIAQAHYEAYQRLAGKTADWETFDPAQKGVMTATIADLIRAGVLVAGPSTSAGYLELYVVCTNRPGPGAAALIREALEPLGALSSNATEIAAYEEALEKATEAVAGACEFIELEDVDGRGYGLNVCIDWQDHPRVEGGVTRLGPFRPFDHRREHLALAARGDMAAAED